jgi:hypothetical protein
MMQDFNKLKYTCDQTSRISATVIDEFILHYAAAKDNLAREFDLRIASYKHLTKTEAESAWVRMLKSQYIIHRVFKSGGLLRKYLNHAEVKRRSQSEQEFLKEQLLAPWRFSFSVISAIPAPDFYQMEDVLSGESFMLYSKSVTQTLKEQSAMLWFNLIAFNGSCWQTFGPLNAYQSFDLDDIFFFATELNPGIDSEESLTQDVEKNPVPYMMLLNGAMMPVTVNKADELLIVLSEHDVESIDVEKLKDRFKVEYNSDVFRITLPEFGEPPHLTAAYFDENENRMVLSSMTERGFDGLVKELNQFGFDISPEPQIRVHPSMFVTSERILKKRIILHPYEKLFFPEATQEQKNELAKINKFLQSVLPAINAGTVLNIEALAREAGVDEAFAKKLVEDTRARIEAMKKRHK